MTIKIGDAVQVREHGRVWHGTVTRIDPNWTQDVPARAINIYVEPGADHVDGEGRCFVAMCSVPWTNAREYQQHSGRRFRPEIEIAVVS